MLTREDGYCACETLRHFDIDLHGEQGHPYGQANGPTKRLNVPWMAGEPFCEECQLNCWPEYSKEEKQMHTFHIKLTLKQPTAGCERTEESLNTTNRALAVKVSEILSRSTSVQNVFVIERDEDGKWVRNW